MESVPGGNKCFKLPAKSNKMKFALVAMETKKMNREIFKNLISLLSFKTGL